MNLNKKISQKKWRDKNKENISSYYKKWDEENKDIRKKYFKNYQNKNKEKLSEYSKIYREENKEKLKIYRIEYQEKNKNNRNIRLKKRRIDDIIFKLNSNMSTNIYLSLKNGKNNNSWTIIVEYTIEKLIKHLELLWKEGMSWDNYGVYKNGQSMTWHIDHIKPKSWFKFESYGDPEFKECWSLENLQPMWADENLMKSNKYIG